MRILIILFIFLISPVFAKFGQYNMQNAQMLAIERQIHATLQMQARQKVRYQRNPLTSIRYPSMANPYPNIQRSDYSVTRRQRYSPRYYQSL